MAAAAADYDFGPAACTTDGLAASITANEKARPLFARGMAFMLNYNHEEARPEPNSRPALCGAHS